MSALATEHFYSSLPLNRIPVSQLVGEEQLFFEAPADWHVIITDVKNSTQALNDGLHHLVNLVATGSIIAAVNIARRANITLPFFFGGDGATILVPPPLLGPTMLALTKHRENTFRNFGLELRVGCVPVTEIYQAGFKLKIAKMAMSEEFSIPVVLGEGLQYAEKVIKGESFVPDLPTVVDAVLNLEGMECRWNSIEPPENAQEVVCLLVTVRSGRPQAAIFRTILTEIDKIYGPPQSRSPISVRKLRLKATLGKINTEMRARVGGFDLRYLFVNWLQTLFGVLYFRYDKNGRHYLRRLVQLSDTLMLDGRINTVISGTVRQRNSLVAVLEELENQREIHFGLHISTESVMSCYVRDRRDQHIHFVDGLGGGYTQAASMLKRKIGNITTPGTGSDQRNALM